MGQAREVMERATEAFFAKDFDRLRTLYAPDVVATTPDAGTLNGVDALFEWNRPLIEAFPDMRYQLTARHEAGDFVVDQGEVIGTHNGPFRLPDGSSIKPTGKQVRMRSTDMATVRDGKIVQHDFYFDQLDMLTQLGLMEAPATTQT
ncbi:MAG TPA: ester cyclase [Nocardioidaceae bacterium]|nr:ester cyclase [Nocardioidaceae bacterium]